MTLNSVDQRQRAMSSNSPETSALKPEARGPGIDGKLYAELVRALYSTPKSVLSASLVAMAIMMVAGMLSDDWTPTARSSPSSPS